jgi:ATP synthase protein I
MAFRLGPKAGEEARAASVLAAAGWSFAFSIVIGIGGGVALDRWLGTSPWLLFAGLALGFAAAVTSLVRATNAASRPR